MIAACVIKLSANNGCAKKTKERVRASNAHNLAIILLFDAIILLFQEHVAQMHLLSEKPFEFSKKVVATNTNTRIASRKKIK